MTRTLRSRNDEGLAAVEFAMVGSLLFILLFAIIPVGLLIAPTRRPRTRPASELVRRHLADACSSAADGVVTGTVTKPVHLGRPLHSFSPA